VDVVVDRRTLSASSRNIAGLAQLRAQIGIALNGRRRAAGETDVNWGKGGKEEPVIAITDRGKPLRQSFISAAHDDIRRVS